LLAAALKLIAEKGVARTTLAEVGEAAGYSRALPAVYFTDKSGLVRALWNHVSEQFQLKMLRAKKGRREGLDALLDFIEVYLTRSDEDPIAFRASQVLLAEAFTSAPEIRESVARNNREAEAFLRTQIRRGIDRGEIRRDVDPVPMAILILAALRGAISHWIIDPKTNLAALRKEYLLSVRRSLARA
jgi:AcrR family transcriptional regulator